MGHRQPADVVQPLDDPDDTLLPCGVIVAAGPRSSQHNAVRLSAASCLGHLVPCLDRRAKPSTALSLSGCAAEPIHVPGAIQPHGWLACIDAADGALIAHSENWNRL
ncbi:MAG: hypothetical protein ABIV63_14630, partial [Caldimonas sp.]